MTEEDQSSDRVFEAKKWEDEKALRTRALDLQEFEIRAKLDEQKRSRWSNPLVLAVLAAALAGVSNAVATWMTAQNQLALEHLKDFRERGLAQEKEESERILEMVKYVDPDQVARNLTFLLDTMLITNKEQRENIVSYLKNRPGGGGSPPVKANRRLRPMSLFIKLAGLVAVTVNPKPASRALPVYSPNIQVRPFLSSLLTKYHAKTSLDMLSTIIAVFLKLADAPLPPCCERDNRHSKLFWLASGGRSFSLSQPSPAP